MCDNQSIKPIHRVPVCFLFLFETGELTLDGERLPTVGRIPTAFYQHAGVGSPSGLPMGRTETRGLIC